MEPTYRIAKWQDTFEKSDSKRYKSLLWISLPTSFAGNGYQSLLDEFGADAPALYGAWCALACFAAQCPVRGTLASGRDAPITIARIARVTGFPAALFEKLYAWASRKDIGWLELAPPPGDAPESPERHPSDNRQAEPSDAQQQPDPVTRASPERQPAEARPIVGLRNERNQTNITDGRTDAGACDRATVGEAREEPAAPIAASPIVLTADRWDAARPLMKRIANVIDPGWTERNGGRLKPGDRELCWTVATLALWQLGEAWLDAVLDDLSKRKDPPPNRWGYFRGAMITATKRLGEDFHALEKLVELSPEVADREAAKTPRRGAAVPA